MNLSQILIRPVMTEKSVSKEIYSKYSFVIHQDATKIDVKNAFLELYGVKVDKVNILRGLPKSRLGRGRKPMEKRHESRRAIITLKAGEKLDLSKSKPTKTPKAATASK